MKQQSKKVESIEKVLYLTVLAEITFKQQIRSNRTNKTQQKSTFEVADV